MAMRFNDEQQNDDEMHEINVTPFIDVMLVLLIIFMVAAPLATVDIKVELPSSNGAASQRPEKPIYLSVNANQQLFIGDQAVTSQNMLATLNQLTANDKTTTIFFRADKSVNYETVIMIIDKLRAAGYTKIGLVSLAQKTVAVEEHEK